MNPVDKNKNSEDPVIANVIASDERAAAGEGAVKAYDDILPAHPALEDTDEISSTDDV
jgi:hypothetical protein